MRPFLKLAAALVVVSCIVLPVLCEQAGQPDWREPKDLRNKEFDDPRVDEQPVEDLPESRRRSFAHDFDKRRQRYPDFPDNDDLTDKMHHRQKPMEDLLDLEITEDDIMRLPHLKVIYDMYKSGKINKGHPLYRQMVGTIQQEKYSRMSGGRPDRPGAMPPGHPHDPHRDRMFRNGQFGNNIPPNARRPSEEEMKRMREKQRKEFEDRRMNPPV